MFPKKQGDKVPPVRTQARSATILPSFVGLKFEIHNGKDYHQVVITEDMVGHKLGEFSPYVSLFPRYNLLAVCGGRGGGPPRPEDAGSEPCRGERALTHCGDAEHGNQTFGTGNKRIGGEGRQSGGATGSCVRDAGSGYPVQ